MGAPLRRGDRAGSRLQLLAASRRHGGGAQASMKTGDACVSVVCARASMRCAPCHTTAPGRTARSRAASAVSASYTPSARRATHTAYVAAATAAAQRFAPAARRAIAFGEGAWLPVVWLVAGISFGLGVGLEHMHPDTTTRRAYRRRRRQCAVRAHQGARARASARPGARTGQGARLRRARAAFGGRKTRRSAAFWLGCSPKASRRRGRAEGDSARLFF